jgi:hypothetical protein
VAFKLNPSLLRRCRISLSKRNQSKRSNYLGVKFLGTPIEQFDELCREEEKVKITITCTKEEALYNHNSGIDGRGTTVEMEDTITVQWGQQIKSSKDIFEFVDDEDSIYDIDAFKNVKEIIRKTQERLVN